MMNVLIHTTKSSSPVLRAMFWAAGSAAFNISLVHLHALYKFGPIVNVNLDLAPDNPSAGSIHVQAASLCP